MRIAIDGLPLCQRLTGVGHYTVQLAHHLALGQSNDEIAVVSPRRYTGKFEGQTTNLQYLRPTINPLRRVWWRSGLIQYLQKSHCDVFHGTNFDLPASAPCATVVTVHDLSTILYPRFHEAKNVNRARQQLPAVVATATAVVTPTESIRHEVHEHLHVPLERIFSVVEAARDCFQPISVSQTFELRRQLGIGDHFLLYVGTLEPRKNLLSLVEAFEDIVQAEPELKLVIAGGVGWLVEDLLEHINNSPVRERIVLTGYRTDEELRSLYSSCKLFVYPSVYEGFGLPTIEAMACGAPVIASKIASVQEVVADAACLVDPNRSDLGDTIRKLLADSELRHRLSDTGKKQAAKFSWHETANRMRDVYEEAIERFRLRKS